MMKTAPTVSVVIVNYCRWQETVSLVRQLLDHPALYREKIEITVVDNASSASPLERELRADVRVRVLRLPKNRGFAAGVNAGLKATAGRWLLVMNPDLLLPEDFLDQVCAAARDLDDQNLDDQTHNGLPVGIVGFQQRNADGSPQPSAGAFPTLGLLLAGLFRPRQVRKYLNLSSPHRCQVPWVTGSCLLVRRDCLQQLGGFDEQFFLYYEDVDLCRRATEQGWAVCYEPAVQAVHLHPLQNRRPTALMRAVTRHACLTYFSKHLSGRPFRWLARIVRAEAWVRQMKAQWQSRRRTAEIYRELRRISGDLARQEPGKARRRLDHLIRAHSPMV